MKKIILVSTEFFPPAFRAGGPVKSVKNYINILKKKYTIFLITSAKDLNQNSYMDLEKVNVWIKKDGINIIYVGSIFSILSNLMKVFVRCKIDFCYVTSFFNTKFSLITIIFSLLFKKQVIIAPKGELFDGALSSKRVKKKIFIYFFIFFKNFLKIKWHATSSFEKKQIQKKLNVKKSKIIICSNVVELSNKKHFVNIIKSKMSLKIIIPCRIAPVKNIFRTILSFKNLIGNIEVHLFGVIDDYEYWNKCENEILKLPNNVNVKYQGPVHPEYLFKIYSNHNVLLMPSLSENFGYSIFEALSFGLPVIIGKNNPWIGMEKLKIGFNVDSKNTGQISEKIQHFVNLGEKDFKQIRENCMLFTEKYCIQKNRTVKNILLNNFFE